MKSVYLIMLLLIIVGLCFLGYGAIKFHEAFNARKASRTNPYIEVHKKISKNDEDYDEYLKWLDENPDAPMDKIKYGPENNIDEEIKKALS